MKKINLYINNCYICSSYKYKTCKEFINRVKKDKKIFVASVPDEIIYIKNTDRIFAHFTKIGGIR